MEDTLMARGNVMIEAKYGGNWVFLVAQLVKNLHVMQKTLVQFLGQEDPLVKG